MRSPALSILSAIICCQIALAQDTPEVDAAAANPVINHQTILNAANESTKPVLLYVFDSI